MVLYALKEVAHGLQPITSCESGVVIDLFLSYRAVKGWQEMIDLVPNDGSTSSKSTVMVQEQLGLALNRAGRSEEAEQVLKDLIERRGPSSGNVWDFRSRL